RGAGVHRIALDLARALHRAIGGATAGVRRARWRTHRARVDHGAAAFVSRRVADVAGAAAIGVAAAAIGAVTRKTRLRIRARGAVGGLRGAASVGNVEAVVAAGADALDADGA